MITPHTQSHHTPTLGSHTTHPHSRYSHYTLTLKGIHTPHPHSSYTQGTQPHMENTAHTYSTHLHSRYILHTHTQFTSRLSALHVVALRCADLCTNRGILWHTCSASFRRSTLPALAGHCLLICAGQHPSQKKRAVQRADREAPGGDWRQQVL